MGYFSDILLFNFHSIRALWLSSGKMENSPLLSKCPETPNKGSLSSHVSDTVQFLAFTYWKLEYKACFEITFDINLVHYLGFLLALRIWIQISIAFSKINLKNMRHSIIHASINPLILVSILTLIVSWIRFQFFQDDVCLEESNGLNSSKTWHDKVWSDIVASIDCKSWVVGQNTRSFF